MKFMQAVCSLALSVVTIFMSFKATAQIKVLAPDGGERFTTGNVVPILWTGIPLTDSVDIQFSSDSGTTWQEIAVGVTGGKYLWSIPEFAPSGTCLIRVSKDESGNPAPKFIRSYQGHSSGANSVDISPDARYLVTAGADGVLILWNLSTGTEIWRKKGHSSPIILTRFSPDGSLIATGSIDGTAIIWNVLDGSPLHILEGEGGRIWPIGFSPDGEQLASGNDDGTVSLWDVTTGTVVDTFAPHSEAVRYLEYTPDGSKILTSSTDRKASIVDAQTGQVMQSVTHTTAAIGGPQVITNGVQLTHDKTVLISCGYDGWVRFWDAKTGKLLTEKNYHHSKEVSEVHISPNGKLMASVGYDGTTKLVDPHTGAILFDISPNMTGMIRSSFSSDSRYLALSHFDGKATLWQLPVPESDISDGTWGVDVCEFELSDIKGSETPGFARDELDLKAHQ